LRTYISLGWSLEEGPLSIRWPPGVKQRNLSAIAPTGRTYACHYCERSNGLRTKDYKHPKMYGGTTCVGNIVRCCRMCNSIKDARLYEWFVLFFRQFLELHSEEYRTANPDDWSAIGAMTRKFNAWLHGLNHAEEGYGEVVDDVVSVPDEVVVGADSDVPLFCGDAVGSLCTVVKRSDHCDVEVASVYICAG